MDTNGKTWLIGCGGLVLLLFLSWSYMQSIYSAYEDAYGIPYGKSDVDNYIRAFEKDDYGQYSIHLWYTNMIKTFSIIFGVDVGTIITYYTPLFCFIILPTALFTFFGIMYLTECRKKEAVDNAMKVLLAVFFTIYGTYQIYFMGIVSVWAQFFSYFLFMLGVAAYAGKIKKLEGYAFSWLHITLCIFLSIIFHLYTIFPILILIICLTLRRKPLLSLVAGIFMALFAMLVFPQNLIEYTFYSSHYSEVSLKDTVFYCTNIFLVIAAALRIREILWADIRNTELEWRFILYTIVMYLVGIVSHNSRALIYAQPFIIYYAVTWIYRRENRFYLLLATVYTIYYFLEIYRIFLNSMFLEMSRPIIDHGRNMNNTALKIIYGIR